MIRLTLLFVLWVVAASGAAPSLPSSLQAKIVPTAEGADIYVRYGGTGPVVILLHGYTDTGDMWAPLAAELIRTHTLVVPDLRGIGRSSHPAGGYDKKTQASDIRSVVTASATTAPQSSRTT